MKNLMKIGFVLCMLLVSGCGSQPNKTTQEMMTIQAFNENKEVVDVEVPYNPQRIAVLDNASLDILDQLGLGDRIVGSSSISIDYLKDYQPNDSTIMNLGTIKTADLEKVAACQPDVIFIGGRLASVYQDLAQIAPVVYLGIDYEKGILKSSKENAMTIASMFGKESEIEALFTSYQPRIDALANVLQNQEVVLGMYNANTLGLLSDQSQLNIIVKELGAKNIGTSSQVSHGEEASWESIVKLNPTYMFILDRSSATASTDGVKGVKEVVENDLIKTLDVYRNNKIIYFVEHANVWYTATGGIQALDIMLSDLENTLLD